VGFFVEEANMIEGRLVNLRAAEMDDLERNRRWMNDREVIEYLISRYPISLATEEEWMRGRAGAQISFANVFFAIETKDGQHIGNISFNQVSQEDRNARLGILIGEKDYWSRGYGTDAILTFLRFAFDEMNLHRVELGVAGPNTRARACYRKCGFVEEGRAREAGFVHGRYIDGYTMGILRDEFYALHGATKEAKP
jgi:RimJ/RimL family protein N-acetyltransferase